MLPEGFLRRIKLQKYVDSELLTRSLDEPSPVSIRLNRMKWQKQPERSEKVPWASDAYYLNARPSFTLDPLFHAGSYYPQEASSMFLEQFIQRYAGSADKIKVLDLCGAPGGKSTHLATLLGTNGFLVSNEVIVQRANVLSETLTKWGTGNFIVTQNDPADFRELPGYFDVIVVDAPCSGEGMFRTEIARTEWSEANAAHCSERQKRILQDIWPALKENGLLIYSTCTFNPSENEENVSWLVTNNNAVTAEVDISSFSGIEEIDYQGIKGYGFHPGKIRGEGFFIAAVIKKETTGFMKQASLKGDNSRPGKHETDALKKYFDIDDRRLLKWNDLLLSLPCDTDDYRMLKQRLRIVKHGTRLASLMKNNLVPEHDVALSHLIKPGSFPLTELGYDDAVAFLRRDIMKPDVKEKGWNIVTYGNVPLGWIKNIGARINNYYPVEWRIRMQKSTASDAGIIKWA